jgi:hypothetical protein
MGRVSSKQTKINFGSNRNKPKQDLFCVCFGLFRETKNKKFRFVSVFRTYIETIETNRSVSEQTETNRNNPNFSEKFPNILSFKLFGWVFCLFQFNRNIETPCLSIETKQPKQTVLKQTKKYQKNEKKRKNRKKRKNPNFFVKNSKICSLSNCSGWTSVCFGSIKTSKVSGSV